MIAITTSSSISVNPARRASMDERGMTSLLRAISSFYTVDRRSQSGNRRPLNGRPRERRTCARGSEIGGLAIEQMRFEEVLEDDMRVRTVSILGEDRRDLWALHRLGGRHGCTRYGQRNTGRAQKLSPC